MESAYQLDLAAISHPLICTGSESKCFSSILPFYIQSNEGSESTHSQPNLNPETHPIPQSLATLDGPRELISTVTKMGGSDHTGAGTRDPTKKEVDQNG